MSHLCVPFNISGTNVSIGPLRPVQIFTCPVEMHTNIIVFVVFDSCNLVNNALRFPGPTGSVFIQKLNYSLQITVFNALIINYI